MRSQVTSNTTAIDNGLGLAPDIKDYNGTRASTPGSTTRLFVGSGDQRLGNGTSSSLQQLAEDNLDEVNNELTLPPLRSIFIVIATNALMQLSFFIIVSSVSAYAEHLGGTATFAGLTVGIPTLFSGIALVFITKHDKGGYTRPFNIAYAGMILGNLLHALAFLANYLYLILIGRIVAGLGFTSFLFVKRYCSDPRIVGVRRRTMLASWIVLGQGFGFTAGPFLGGLLYKIGFPNKVFNGYTGPGWFMAGVGILFWITTWIIFEDPPPPKNTVPLRVMVATRMDYTTEPHSDTLRSLPDFETTISTPSLNNPADSAGETFRDLDRRQWGVIICMCYYAMTCFFILAAWEVNIPIYSAIALNYSPYQAGNFIALGGVATLPFLLLNIRFARRIQDRVTLGIGSALGLFGLITMLLVLRLDKISFGTFYLCWFLVALGFNLASTCTLSLLSKQMPGSWNSKLSMAIQYSNYTGRVTGAVLGGAGVKIGMMNYIAIQIAIVGLGGLIYMTLWRELKAKTG